MTTQFAEHEEAILNTHMSHIQENAALLTAEGALLAHVQRPGATAADAERYAAALEEILAQREGLIYHLRARMAQWAAAADEAGTARPWQERARAT